MARISWAFWKLKLLSISRCHFFAPCFEIQVHFLLAKKIKTWEVIKNYHERSFFYKMIYRCELEHMFHLYLDTHTWLLIRFIQMKKVASFIHCWVLVNKIGSYSISFIKSTSKGVKLTLEGQTLSIFGW